MNQVKTMAEGRYLRLVDDQGWEYTQRLNISGIVVLIAVTPENKLLLVEQHRPPVGGRVIELPAGLAGDIVGSESESLTEAAKRELMEETGYRAGVLEELFKGPPAPGMSDEIVTLYLAHDLTKVGAGGGDETEDITVHEVPLEEAEDWILTQSRRGVLIDPKVFTGIHFGSRMHQGQPNQKIRTHR